MAKITWNEFRALHPGIELSEVSDCWKQYKEGEYSIDIPVGETQLDVEPTPKAEPPADEYVQYNNLYNETYLEDIEEAELVIAQQKLIQFAKDMGNYKPSVKGAGWTLWFGPVRWGLLVNQGNQYAFLITRSWWTRLFQGSVLVEYNVVEDEDRLEEMKANYSKENALFKRYPIPGVEFIVPASRLYIPLPRGLE